MRPRRIAAINAILFFFFWLFILLAGADFPPPVGFLWLVRLVPMLSIGVSPPISTGIAANALAANGTSSSKESPPVSSSLSLSSSSELATHP
jgi:hypothetical protein